ncbi:FAD-dependent oxidoreductase [Longispora fulva]|uniref:2-polyprenyl-6-methoxyphenol hydroxylase-like FAD-dependent oxidoreductase n=1 Tax=Longispora fulva TaxID=619741 RepID=A0A8J7KG07_9ACTN|nr:FAD-dependent monooxygenase [Longispora fulva]MBG6134404.1 2-polyprenyl-6-methoxyphenol hydroxylase-like FAD-dependent oxidoreductase [Longispora fulva]GIG62679.1 FAD-dependent oxidoreductase [Longispora fulva]
MHQRILIVGASIAGLTVAHWLDRYGFRTTVVERATSLRTGGNGVDLREGAVEVADRMGILPDARAAGTDVRGMRFVDAADRTIGQVGIGEPGSVELMRGDLVDLLHRAGGSGIEYIFGDAVRDLAQDDSGVTVSFEHAPDRRFDLVIGADGLHSTVRALAFGPHREFVRHRDHYFAFADTGVAAGENRWMTMYNLPGKMVGVYRSGNHAQAKAYFIFRSAPLDYDHRDVDEHRRLVARAFAAETSWWIPDLLAEALADPEFYFDALSQVHMKSWSSGRVALVGDAAWCASPASGAGAELAMVGGYRLAGELAAAGGDHLAAFARYHDGHRVLVDSKQRIGPNLRLMVPRTVRGRWLRDAAARLPLLRAASAVERWVRARVPALPEYLPAR